MNRVLAMLLLCGCSSSPMKSIAPDLGSAPDGGVASLSDPFAGASLDPAWSVLHPEPVASTVPSGALPLRLTGFAFWFNAAEGVLVYKMVSGDFKLTSTVHTRKASMPTLPPDRVELSAAQARPGRDGVDGGGDLRSSRSTDDAAGRLECLCVDAHP